jgi:nitrate reductase NapD
MEVSSMVLRTRPELLPRVRAELTRIPGVEVHAQTDDGRVALTVEDVDGFKVADSITRLHEVPGVIAISLIYEYSDDMVEA